MEITVNERIIRIKKNEGLTNEKMSNRTNVPIETLKSMFSKKTNPNLDTIQKIYRAFPHYSLEWIICGTGEMLKNSIVESKEVKFVDTNFLLDRIEKLAIQNNKLEEELEQLKKTSKRNVVPTSYSEGGEQLIAAEKIK